MPTRGVLHQSTDDSAVNLNDVVVGVTPATTLTPNANSQIKRVIYEPTSLSVANPTDTFEYTVSDGSVTATATVTVKLVVVTTPDDISLTFNENELKTIVLGGVNADGLEPVVVIKSLPSKGTLYQANFQSNTPGTYGQMLTNTALLTPITAIDTVLTDFHGLVLYKPIANDFSANASAIYADFTFAWRHPVFTSSESVAAKVNMIVLFKNDPPIGAVQDLTFHDVNSTIITLGSSDTDGSTVGNSRFYRIFDFPKMGTLHQVVESNGQLVLGDSIVDVGNVPTVVAWASSVLGASSQFTRCDADGCANYTNCPVGCPNGVTDYHAVQVLGQPDAFPVYGDSAVTWSFATLDSPVIEYIIVRYPNPVFISGMDLYENQAPGALISVEVAKNYKAASTAAMEWVTVWEGPVQQSLPATYRIFSPPICPVGFLTDVVRLRFDSAAILGWSEIDAIRLVGTISMPKGKVVDVSGRVAYVPRTGLHRDYTGSPYDTFSFKVTDCVTESPASTTVTIARTSEAFEVAHPTTLSQWKSQPVTLMSGQTSTVRLNLTEVLEDLIASNVVSANSTITSLGGALVQIVGATIEGMNFVLCVVIKRNATCNMADLLLIHHDFRWCRDARWTIPIGQFGQD